MIVNTKKGFTLVELLVTVTLLATLSSMGIAQFEAYRKNAYDAKAATYAKDIFTALKVVEETYLDNITNISSESSSVMYIGARLSDSYISYQSNNSLSTTIMNTLIPGITADSDVFSFVALGHSPPALQIRDMFVISAHCRGNNEYLLSFRTNTFGFGYGLVEGGKLVHKRGSFFRAAMCD